MGPKGWSAMRRYVSVSAVAILLGGCGPPAGDPSLFNESAVRLPRERMAVVYQADQGGRCAEFRVVGVDGVEKRRMTPGAFQLSPGRHDLVFHKDGNAGTWPSGGGGVDAFFLELLYMAPALPVCTMISKDMCLRFDATLQPGRSYRLKVDDEESYRLVDWTSGRTVARGEIAARRQPGRPLDCRPVVAASGGATGPALYGPVVAAPGSVAYDGVADGPVIASPAPWDQGLVIPAAAPRDVPAGPKRLTPADGPRELLLPW